MSRSCPLGLAEAAIGCNCEGTNIPTKPNSQRTRMRKGSVYSVIQLGKAFVRGHANKFALTFRRGGTGGEAYCGTEV
jgi:hypothetical protein